MAKSEFEVVDGNDQPPPIPLTDWLETHRQVIQGMVNSVTKEIRILATRLYRLEEAFIGPRLIEGDVHEPDERKDPGTIGSLTSAIDTEVNDLKVAIKVGLTELDQTAQHLESLILGAPTAKPPTTSA